jgi:hypothetical protein
MPMPSVNPSGVTTIELMVGAVTVKLLDPVTVLRVAEMVVVPAATPVAIPLLSMVATPVAEDDQFTSPVRSRLLPSA